MGLHRWYLDRVLPRMVDFGMRGDHFKELRPTCVGAARGRVLELGFGSGLNLPHYGDDVEELVAVDPAQLGRELARDRIEAAPFPVSFVDLEGDLLPVDAASFDTVTCTWTLCTIPAVRAALEEVARVLTPGGTFRFLEHGLAREQGVARWQGRLNGVQGCLFGGCRLDRPIDDLVSAAGIGDVSHEEFYSEGPRVFSYLYRGVATKSA